MRELSSGYKKSFSKCAIIHYSGPVVQFGRTLHSH